MTSQSSQSLNKQTELFRHILELHFKIPNVVWVTGVWKSGKTDFALWLCEMLDRFDIVSLDHVATNIFTNKRLIEITDYQTLIRWYHSDKLPKVYVFDEVNTHLSRRRSMSKKNVKLLDVLPEISKARGRMIVIGQDIDSADKTLKNSAFVRGIFYKVNLQSAILISPLLRRRPYRMRSVPKTSIYFDPYIIAPMTLKPQIDEFSIIDRDQRLLFKWATGEKNWKDFNMSPTAFMRWKKKAVMSLFEKLSLQFTNSGGGVNSPKEEPASP